MKSIGIKSSLITEKSMDANLVYKMLRGLYLIDLNNVQSQHSVLKSLTMKEAVRGLTGAPFHPGAVKFYHDHGVKVPEALIPPEMKL